MILSAKAEFSFSSEPFLAFIERREGGETLVARKISHTPPLTFDLKLGDANGGGTHVASIPRDFSYLDHGDIVRLNPRSSDIRVMYRRRSRHNSLFVTERCNSRCVMCSQPPREIDDSYLVDDILRMLPWMDVQTKELGITGGEPTVIGDRLIEVIQTAKKHLPRTALHMLSNGRLFADLAYAERIADTGHPDFMIGVPLYADIAATHDFVVQAAGAFTETILGLLNLARVGLRVELRVVIHRETYVGLPRLVKFIARNLPFVEHVAFMGLEPIGFGRTNLKALWIDPFDYQDELEQAVVLLDDAGIAPRIYNHQLCVLRSSLHRFAVRSISDWKNAYLLECDSCSLQVECGGFFRSALNCHSAHIRAVLPVHA